MAVHVLVVDDDPVERRHVEDILRSQGHSVECADGGDAALSRLARTGAPRIAAVILDLVMPETDGMMVLERMVRLPSAPPVIVQTGRNGADAGASAIRAGAIDFLVKPASPERIAVSLMNALKISALEGEIVRMRLSRAGTLTLGDIVMRSPAMARVTQLAERAAHSAIPVLIEGERGVGKALLARAIHGSSTRRSRPFVVFRSAGAAPSEIMRELFGEAPEAIRPAGKIGEAAGGTLFIDEIGALPPAAQTQLARCLADDPDRQRPARGDLRLIAATERRLLDLVHREGFAEELFNRLNVLPIWLPPLRDRRDDIPGLVRGFTARYAAEAGRPGVTGISNTAMALLAAARWPGNIRELEHMIFRAVSLSAGGELLPHDFPSLTGTGAASAEAERTRRETAADSRKITAESAALPTRRADTARLARYGVARLLDERGEMRPFGVLEEEMIRFAIGHYGGHLSEVARRLGIGRSTLYRKIRDYGIAAGEAVAQ